MTVRNQNGPSSAITHVAKCPAMDELLVRLFNTERSSLTSLPESHQPSLDCVEAYKQKETHKFAMKTS